MKYLKYILCFLLLAVPLFAQERVALAPDVEDQTLQFFFKGQWLPDLDPAEIGPDNYSELKNLRYGPADVGLEGVQGYSKINTTALTTYTLLRSGIQLETDRSTASYVLVQAENSDESASRVVVNDTAIPDQGDFSDSIELDTSGNEYRDDTAGAGLGRWSKAPNGSVTYCNGIECLIWSGEEMRVGAFITMENADPFNAAALPENETEAINNSLATTGNTVQVASGDRDYFLVMTTRKIQGVYFDISSANTTAAVLDIHYWKGGASPAWTALTEADGTLDDGKTLAQDGWVTWNYVSDASPYHYQGLYLYAYRFYVNDSAAATADATIQYVAVNAPMQPILDLEDGVPRQPTQFKVWRNNEGVFKDYTLEVNEYSKKELPQIAPLDGMSTSDYIIIMSDDQLSGIQFDFIEGFTNLNAATTSVTYWNGSTYASITGEIDGTALSGDGFGQNGLLWWEPQAAEQKKTEFGVTGYSYKVKWNAALSGTYYGKLSVSDTADDTEIKITTSTAHNLGTNDVVTITGIVGTTEANGTWAINDITATTFNLTGSTWAAHAYTSGGEVVRAKSDIMAEPGDVGLDVVTCIPAQKTVKPFKFPSLYKNRTLLCGYTQGKEGNRCDFSITNTTEGWNGAESSDDGVQSLYFGSSEPLTAGEQIYNRYGSQVITLWTALKESETYVLKGKSPEDFTVERVSSNIGCPAPLTLASAEVAFEMAEGVRRNMLFWLDASGVYSFDGQVLVPVKGIEKYFDPDDADCINFDEIERSRGWYDASKKEYNLLIPSGSSQTTNNVWLVYDIIKKKWFRKDTGSASFPQLGFPVTDAYGAKYVYGGIDSGYMMRLENGTSWDGTAIEQIVETGDFWPTGNIWDLTRIRQIKVMAKRIPEAHQLTVTHSSNTDDSLGLSGIWQNWSGGEWEDWEGGEWVSASLASIELSLSDSINRIARDTIQDNLFGWSHRLGFSVSTDETTKGLQPLGWGIVFQKVPQRDE